MPVEEIIKEIARNQKAISQANENIKNLTEQLLNSSNEYVSVRIAAQMLSVSVGAIYHKINSGELKVKHFGSKKLIAKKDLLGY